MVKADHKAAHYTVVRCVFAQNIGWKLNASTIAAAGSNKLGLTTVDFKPFILRYVKVNNNFLHESAVACSVGQTFFFAFTAPVRFLKPR